MREYQVLDGTPQELQHPFRRHSPSASRRGCHLLLPAIAGFARLGHSVRALAPITATALQSGDAFALSHPDISVKRYLVPYFYTAPNIPSPDSYRRLESERIQERLPAMIASRRPDIIIMGRETFAWDVPDLARDHSIPCVLRVAGTTTLGILNGTYPEALAQQLLEQYRKANLIITPAEHLAKLLQQIGVNNIKVVPNAVDLYQFAPRPKDIALLRELAIQDDNIIVVHASNLKDVKRPLDIANSAHRALQHNPKLVYVIVGDGPLRVTMEEACRQRSVSERFRFVGWVDYDRMPDYINLADMVVMPSEGEGLARVYLETQACGRLLLASNIPPAREVIVDGETGLLFRMGDTADLTAKTLLAAGDPQLRADIGRKAQERVQAHDINRAVAAYINAMEETIQWCHG